MLEVNLKLTCKDESILISPEEVEDLYGGSYLLYLKEFLKEEGKFEFIDWFEPEIVSMELKDE